MSRRIWCYNFKHFVEEASGNLLHQINFPNQFLWNSYNLTTLIIYFLNEKYWVNITTDHLIYCYTHLKLNLFRSLNWSLVKLDNFRLIIRLFIYIVTYFSLVSELKSTNLLKISYSSSLTFVIWCKLFVHPLVGATIVTFNVPQTFTCFDKEYILSSYVSSSP